MRRSCPHMPIMKYMGISVSSQKTKKRKRSSETKTPIMAVSMTRRAMKKPLTFSRIDSQEHKIAMGVRNVVSRTRNRLIPSMPR